MFCFTSQVSFVPTGDINFKEEPSDVTEFYQQFDDIEVGSTIYTLRAHQSPEDNEGILLGNVVTTDKCVTSLYGDTKLYFQHQYIAEDKALKPEWAYGYDSQCSNFCQQSLFDVKLKFHKPSKGYDLFLSYDSVKNSIIFERYMLIM